MILRNGALQKHKIDGRAVGGCVAMWAGSRRLFADDDAAQGAWRSVGSGHRLRYGFALACYVSAISGRDEIRINKPYRC